MIKYTDKVNITMNKKKQVRNIRVAVMRFILVSIFIFLIGMSSLTQMEDGTDTIISKSNDNSIKSDTDSNTNSNTNIITNPISASYSSEVPFVIDENGYGDYTWSELKLAKSWCTGSGTENDPYVIDGISINGQDGQICLSIENSSVNFIIRNSLFYNQSGISYSAVYFNKVTNGNFFNNICNDSSNGFYLDNSSYNTISWNYLGQNEVGIYIRYVSQYNQILYNNISDCTSIGIFIWPESDYNDIKYNLISNGNTAPGIYVAESSNIILQNNTIINKQNGIYVSQSSHIQVLDNYCYQNDWNGISIYNNVNYSIISGNIVSDNADNGIRMQFDCFQNEISNNTVLLNDYYGISVESDCGDNEVINNILTDNWMSGIYIYDYCVRTTISGNILNGDIASSYGIFVFDHCEGNTIFGNDITDFGDGIYIASYSTDNIIENNYIYENTVRGIYISGYCDQNSIINNLISNHQRGIDISTDTVFNDIFNNSICYNTLQGIYLHPDVDYNHIKHNDLYGNEVGLLLEGTKFNIIEENLIRDSYELGIYCLSLNSEFYSNYFINNTAHISDNDTSMNNYYDEIGNYYDTYGSDGGIDSNIDGIGDDPYTIPGTSGYLDNLPIWDVVGPIFNKLAGNITYFEGSENNVAIWSVLDNTTRNSKYFIYMGDELIVSNADWSSGANITLNIDGLPSGIYNFTLIVTDNHVEPFGIMEQYGLANINSTIIFVTVVEYNASFWELLLENEWFYFILGALIGLISAIMIYIRMNKKLIDARTESSKKIEPKS